MGRLLPFARSSFGSEAVYREWQFSTQSCPSHTVEIVQEQIVRSTYKTGRFEVLTWQKRKPK